ncbi:MAG: hypothetical protein Q9195_001583 [Heterodermia aff. obscurata]
MKTINPSPIQKALLRKMHHFQDPSKMFIGDSELRAVWQDYTLSTIFPAEAFTLEQWQQIRKDYLKVLSILIWINWTPLAEQFDDVFFKHPDRGDAYLPFSIEDLFSIEKHSVAFEGSGLMFFQFQYAFLPVVIHQSEKMFVRNLEPMERLPFIDAAHELGSGGFGHITKVVIAPRSLLSEGSENREVYATFPNVYPTCLMVNQAKAVACKTYRTDRSKDDFQNEVRNLNFLREGLIQGGKRIMLHIAAIVQGDNFMILIPLAELRDLDVFLRGGYIAMDDTKIKKKVYDFDQEFPGMVAPSTLLQEALFNQLFEVASALVWLHEELRILGSLDRYCAHMDLKPGNILISRDKDSRVGRWMITDFGISLFDKSTNKKEPEVHSIRDVGPRLTSRAHQDEVIRGRGPYEPPESSNKEVDGRKCDVWSFGCVSSDVMEFALGGQSAVDDFRLHRYSKDRFQGADDYFYQLKPSLDVEPRTRNISNTQVKKEVLDWFESRSSLPPSPWVKDCVGLLKIMLVIDPVQRATARDAMRRLDELMAKHFKNGAVLQQEVTGAANTPQPPALQPEVEPNVNHMRAENVVGPQISVSTPPEEGAVITVITPPASDQRGVQHDGIAIAGLDPLERITLPTHGKAVDVAVSTNGEHVALLYPGYSVRIYRVESGVIAMPEIKLPSSTKWVRLSTTAHYLAVYGIKTTGHKEILIHDLREPEREIMIPTSCEGRQVTHVHLSEREIVACLCGKSIILTHLALKVSEILRLADGDTIDSAASTEFSILPYTSLPVCVLHESHGNTFVGQAFLSEPSLPRARQAIGLPNLMAACVLQDHSLFCVSKGKWLFSDREIHQLPLVQESDGRRLVVSHSSELGTAKPSVSQTARIALVSMETEITVLICTIKGEIFKYRGR